MAADPAIVSTTQLMTKSVVPGLIYAASKILSIWEVWVILIAAFLFKPAERRLSEKFDAWSVSRKKKGYAKRTK